MYFCGFNYQTLITYLFYCVAGLFLACLFVQLYFLVFRHARLRSFKDYGPSELKRPVSVIICARNEEDNLRENLPLILDQQYPDFEVVVVNDCSNDESDFLLRSMSEKYANLKVVTLADHPRFRHGKKFAVTMGIKAAKHECLLFTDADCRPESGEWINLMQGNFEGSAEIVVGYSPYVRKAGLLNALIRYETLFTAMNYLSFALAGHPYMGVGRNLAYKRSLFFRNKGFASHIHIPSGDDDLFVNEHASSFNTVIEIREDAHIWSEPKTTFSSYWKQKRRHMGAGRAYKASDKFVLSLQASSAFLFYTLIPVLIFVCGFVWWHVLSVYAIRLLLQYLVYLRVFKKLRYSDLLWSMPFMDVFFNVFLALVGMLSAFKKPSQWA